MNFAKEAKALEFFTKMLRAADECRALFDEAGMDYPAPLKRLLGVAGDSPGSTNGSRPTLRILPPAQPSRPAGVPEEWVFVPIPAMSPQTFVLAALRSSRDVPLVPRELLAQAKAHGLETSEGSISNVGTRFMKAGIISRESGLGWLLVDESRAPILAGDHAWGQPEMFTVQELAARRREMILYVLDHFSEGLQSQQILTRLTECPWLRTPLSKDLLKADMEELQRTDKVRRVGASKKWALAKEHS